MGAFSGMIIRLGVVAVIGIIIFASNYKHKFTDMNEETFYGNADPGIVIGTAMTIAFVAIGLVLGLIMLTMGMIK
jgi:hypothetical protein